MGKPKKDELTAEILQDLDQGSDFDESQPPSTDRTDENSGDGGRQTIHLDKTIPSFSPQDVPAGADPHLLESENISLAKNKIRELEKENERLREENEELASAAQTFRNRLDQVEHQSTDSVAKYKDLKESVEAEKSILMESIKEKDKESQSLVEKISELESRLNSGVKKIRVRERELENRLELVKMEGKALLKSKDEMILKLKREMDQLNMELDNARKRVHESNKTLTQKQDILRRTVKTLRLALSLLETEEISNPDRMKKVD